MKETSIGIGRNSPPFLLVRESRIHEVRVLLVHGILASLAILIATGGILGLLSSIS